ncbi:MAG: beta-lactamase domain protein [Candidatus Ozemobacter sibiricus]|jgi:flavorubredoxin|uniref:Beta-lactamase domain protein n=1 Tax=Candidatus Ozemobacter sibiricus TaxID=2268124 RepID=A0A367ZTH7_9BACT|nr:MAG: beta-lactamase domain protein [Candidatus Ozemobacter sibiricus]
MATSTTPPGDDRPIALGNGVTWVGFWDSAAGLHCNPYLIVDGEEAVLIDGGSRPDFSTVMMKVLQAGVAPHQIKALIYHHYDPDLCGSLPNLEDMIRRPDLQIISAAPNHMFIRHYSTRARLVDLTELNHRFRFASGRELQFVVTPFAHSAGSFMTFDPASGILFTSDLFGSPGNLGGIFMTLLPDCEDHHRSNACTSHREGCPMRVLIRFHKQFMPSTAALRHAMSLMRGLPFKILAPQHGAIIRDRAVADLAIRSLEALEHVGIDGVLAGDPDLLGRPF